MKNIGAMQSKVGNDAFKGWLIGAGCGVLLTLSLAMGTGRLVLNHAQTNQPGDVLLRASLVTGEGAVPPPLDEFAQYHVFQPAVLSNAELVPPIDELQQYRRDAAGTPDRCRYGCATGR